MSSTANWPVLAHAPINEAIIDIQTQIAPDFDIKNLAALHAEIKDLYPTIEETGGWDSQGEKISAAAREPHYTGYLFRSTDEKQVVQFRLDGFTFSRLRPYEDWITLKKEATRLWEIYVNATKPVSVLKLSARYINEIGIPKNAETLHDWIQASPVLPEGTGVAMRGYFQVVFGVDGATSLETMVTQMLKPVQKDPAEDFLLLDIDVFRKGKFEVNEKVWKTLDDCRDVKNTIFFKTLTEKLVARYK